MNKIIKIGFNGRPFITNEMRGISRHSLNLILELRKINRHLEIHIFSNDYIHPEIKSILDFAHFHEHKIKPKFLWNLWILPNLLRLNNIELFHSTNNVGMPLFGCKKKLLTIHDDITHTHRNNFSFKHLWDYINYKIELLTIKNADAFITVSNDAKNKVSYSYKIKLNKIFPIYNGTNLRESSTKETEDYILYVGGFDDRKNIKFLIEELYNYSPDENLILIGNINSASPALKELIESNKKIKVKSNLTDEELAKMYQESKLIVIPSLYEGFGLPVIEAMQLGTPIAISRIPIFEEVSGGHCHFFDPTLKGNLSILFKQLLTNDDERTKFSSQAKIYSKKFTWEHMAKATYELYLKVLQGL